LNLVEENSIAKNLTYGIRIGGVLGVEINHNDVNKNGSDPIFHGGILVAGSGFASINLNESNRNSGFGIVLDGGGGHTVGSNELNKNGDSGIVLLNGTYGNAIVDNQATKNSVGVVAGFQENFPYANTYDGNTFENNEAFDVVDHDPNCNDIWIANSYETVNAVPGGCFE
jgi:hypothetical protein